MKFAEALKQMKAGTPMKLPSWNGYWRWDDELQTIIIHTKDNQEFDIRNTRRVEYTLQNVLSEDWTPADKENCPVLGGVAEFSFSDAVRYLKRGLKVARKGWNGKDMYLRIIMPGNACCDHFPMQPCIGMKTADCKMQPGWLASQADMLAEDWIIVE